MFGGCNFYFSRTLQENDESIIRSSVLKTFEFIKNYNVMLGFSIYQYLLKSYSRPNGLPHLAYHTENNLIKCNPNCPRSNSERFCSFCVVVALKPKCLKSFANALGECRNKTTTQLAPQKINNEIVG